MKKVLELYKQEGETPLETIERFKEENPEYKQEKMTYAGRLDPMAEGVLLVLVGEECKNKDKYLGLDKEYEFEILWGFETDTYDILGIPKISNSPSTPLNGSLPGTRSLGELEALKGKFAQKYPPYSSMTVGGKQLFQWAREGRLDEIEIPEREVEVYDVEFLGYREIGRKELLENIKERVTKVTGDFRQEEVINSWTRLPDRQVASLRSQRRTFAPQKFFDEKLSFSSSRDLSKQSISKNFLISKVKIKCSSGTYVRGIVNDLGKKLGTGAIAFSIKRTKINHSHLFS